MDKAKRNIYIISAVALALIAVAIYFLFVFPARTKSLKSINEPDEIKPITEISVEKRPYVTLTPTSNGAEIVMSMENMAEFDEIEYELTYLADNPQISGEKIQRGSTGTDVDTKSEKYKKSMLLGTASRGVSSPDRGIEEGKLTLHMIKGDTEYTSESNWDLLEAGAVAQEIKDRDEKITISLPSFSKNYFIIIADTVGVPKSADYVTAKVQLPTLGVFSIAPEFKKSANLIIKVEQDSKLFAHNNQDNSTKVLESEYNSSTNTLSAQVSSFATFVVTSQ